MGRIGTNAYDTAQQEYDRVVVGLDNNQDTVDRHCQAGRKVIFGDAADIDFWDKINPNDISLISLCMTNHQANKTAVEQLQKGGYTGFITAIARFDDEERELKEMGVDAVYNIFANIGSAYVKYSREQYLEKTQKIL